MSNDKMKEALEAVMQILGAAPELNPSNYNHEDACALNAAANEAYNLIDSALSQQPESESVGYISKEYLDALAGETKHLCSTISAEPRHNSSIDYVIPVFTSHRPPAQVPDGWKLVPDVDLDQWLDNISEHGLPIGPHSFMLRTILNLAPAAPSVAEKDQ